jgi:hypothetical protein
MGSGIGLCLVSIVLLLAGDAAGALLNTNEIVRSAAWASVLLVTFAVALMFAAGFWLALELIHTLRRASRRRSQ